MIGGAIVELYKRENYLKKIRGFYHDSDMIKVITGVRRCGKSSLMKTIIEELKESRIIEENIIFLDLDSRGYKSIKKPEQLEKYGFYDGAYRDMELDEVYSHMQTVFELKELDSKYYG